MYNGNIIANRPYFSDFKNIFDFPKKFFKKLLQYEKLCDIICKCMDDYGSHPLRQTVRTDNI